MRKLEFPHSPIDRWHNSRNLDDIRKHKEEFKQLMIKSQHCMSVNHLSQSLDDRSVKQAIQCETIHPQTLSQYTNFTFHTHPSDITYPSEVDKKTTKNLKKQYLVIGHVPTMRSYVYDIEDNFTRPVLVI